MGISFSGGGDTYNLQDESFVNIKITKTTQNYYDYENELNENKRSIKMLRPEYTSALETELFNIFE